MDQLTPDTGLLIWQIIITSITLFFAGAMIKWAIRQYKK